MNRINMVLFIFLLLSFFVLLVIGAKYLFDFEVRNDFCDYDSCSQESFYWEINGSKCFNSSNPDCQDFLKLFSACQRYKDRVGVC